jgi:iron(III) transport system permease protein
MDSPAAMVSSPVSAAGRVVLRLAGRGVSPVRAAMAGAATLTALAIIGLLVVVLLVSLWPPSQQGLTLRNYAGVARDPEVYRALLNTAGFSLTTVATAVLLGLPTAWLTERTDLPGKRTLYSLFSLGILIPGFFFGMAFGFLFDPDAGLVNRVLMQAFGLEHGPIDVASVVGMGLVEGMALAPVVFILSASSLRAVDPALEEAAEMSGANRLTAVARITLPLVWPGILGAAIFVFTIAIAAFDIPLIIGQSRRILTFATYLFQKTSPAQGFGAIPYGSAASLSTVMIAVALAVSVWYTRVLSRARRYQVVTGRGYRPKLVALGRWKVLAWILIGGYFVVGVAVTLAITAWTAFQPFAGQTPSPAALEHLTPDNFGHLPWDTVAIAALHTMVLVLATPSLALLLAVVFSWVVLRSGSRLRLAYDFVAFLPQGVPSVIFAFAAFIAALFLLPAIVPSQFYRSLALLVLVLTLVFLSFATRLTNAALVQIHSELEEAAQVAGASAATVLRRVTLPLIRPALSTGWVWMAFLAYRELAVPTMLNSPDNQTLAVVVYQQWTSNQTYAAALTVVMLLVTVPFVPLAWRLTRGDLLA